MTDTSVTTIAPKPPIVMLKERLDKQKQQIIDALKGQGVSADQFIRVLITSATINPELQACTWPSLWLACMRACRDGLLPDGREAVIVPYKGHAQYQRMYQGDLKKFRQSGQCHWVGAYIVRAGEPFEHYIDERGEHFKHVPGDEAAPIVKVYGAALTKDGAFYTAVLTMKEIDKIKNESRASREDAPWKKWPEEMQKKSALKRLAKLLPSGYAEDEDESAAAPSVDAPKLVPAATPPRPASAADALNQFANAPQPGGPAPEADATGDMGGGGPSEAEAASDDTAAVSSDDPIEAAYRHGIQAKADGLSRRALPGDYRGDDRSREAIAWQAGHDGKAKPEWTP